ncbi:MAG: ABC transporter substrate-binding protein [Microcoleaceae cyanobacterium]|jgi:putative chitobiose transport system substrate-binding protein
MFNKFWRKFCLLTLVGLFLGLGVSCSMPSPQSSGKSSSEVEFWTMQLQPQFTEYFNKLIAAFEAENSAIKVRWVDVPWSDMEKKILASVSAKTAPDVVNLNPAFASLLAGRNAWLDLETKIPETTRSTFFPNIWKASSLNGKSFGIPWYVTTSILISNTDLLNKAGITQPPKTFTELATVAKTVKEKTGKYALFVSFVPEDSSEVLESFVQMGVPLVDAQGKSAFNTPQGKAVFQYWVDLYKNNLLPKEVLTQGHRRAIELYQSGETALLSTGPQFLKTIEQNSPTIAKVSVPAPQITGITGKKSVAVMNLVIPRDSNKAENALKFALYVTNSENQLAFAKAANVLPSTIASLKDSYFKDVPPNASPADQGRIVSASQLPDSDILIPPLQDIQKLKKAIYENLQAAMLDQKSVDNAIADAAKSWDSRSN